MTRFSSREPVAHPGEASRIAPLATVAVTRSLNDSALTEVENDGTVLTGIVGNEALVES